MKHDFKWWIGRFFSDSLKRLVSGLFISLGFALGIYLVMGFQTMGTAPSTTGTADTNNSSSGVPLLTRAGGTYDRNSMSLQTIADSTNSNSANNGLYNNRIQNASYPNAYSEICFKNGTVASDIHSAWQSTAGGNCLPGDIGYVIEQNARTTQQWDIAKTICTMSNMRLPEAFEWKYACKSSATFGINGMGSVWEWAGNTTFPFFPGGGAFITATIFGAWSCTYGGNGWVGSNWGNEGNYQYRCVR